MADDLENPILDGDGDGDDGGGGPAAAVTAEPDDESTLWFWLNMALGLCVWVAISVSLVRFYGSHHTVLGIRALAVMVYVLGIAGLIFSGCACLALTDFFFRGNTLGQQQMDLPV